MKSVPLTLGMVLTALLMGCASKPMALNPVGPDPLGPEQFSDNGRLEVYSAISGHTEGNNPTWYQHTGYYIYNQSGERLRYIDNKRGHYERAPMVVKLPPGKYVVKAKAKDYFWVNIPVEIKAGKLTEVHLDNSWQPESDTAANEIVTAPAGYPVGWSVAASR